MLDVIRALVSRFDILLRRQGRVREFTRDERCILRISLGLSKRDLELSDGTKIRPGDRICELHLWNEHIPAMPREGPNLAWGLKFYRLAVRSFRSLATYIAAQQTMEDIVALRGEMALPKGDDVLLLRGAAAQMGFDVINLTFQAGRWGRFRHFWENMYSWALIWTFNPGSLRRKRFLGLQRYQFWISRQALIQLYGA